MKVWVYVEGESDKLALRQLWAEWLCQLRSNGHGLRLIPLGGKDKFLRKIGPRGAEKLAGDKDDLVVGLPDFYPNQPFARSRLKHETLEELKELQRSAVANALETIYGIRGGQLANAMTRFDPSAFKHDMEMLLLAAQDQLRQVIGTNEQLGRWKTPVEEQDQRKPPKRIVEQLFRTKTSRKRAYRDTKDAPAVLGKVKDIRELLFLKHDNLNCPVFKDLIDWLGRRTGEPAYR